MGDICPINTPRCLNKVLISKAVVLMQSFAEPGGRPFSTKADLVGWICNPKAREKAVRAFKVTFKATLMPAAEKVHNKSSTYR